MTKAATIRDMRQVKKEILKLIQCFIQNCAQSDQDAIFTNFIPALVDPVLDDYKVFSIVACDLRLFA